VLPRMTNTTPATRCPTRRCRLALSGLANAMTVGGLTGLAALIVLGLALALARAARRGWQPAGAEGSRA
jgi:hypothetical protein